MTTEQNQDETNKQIIQELQARVKEQKPVFDIELVDGGLTRAKLQHPTDQEPIVKVEGNFHFF
jgi:hypothetical protein